MLATSTAAEEDTPFPSGTPELTWVAIIDSISVLQLLQKNVYFQGKKDRIMILDYLFWLINPLDFNSIF